MSYLDFLKALAALGSKLPQVFALVQHIADDVRQLIDLVRGPQPLKSGEFNATADEAAAEQEVLGLINTDRVAFGAIGDGAILRALWQFINAHPELLTLLLLLLK